jgi:hypothetical protein
MSTREPLSISTSVALPMKMRRQASSTAGRLSRWFSNCSQTGSGYSERQPVGVLGNDHLALHIGHQHGQPAGGHGDAPLPIQRQYRTPSEDHLAHPAPQTDTKSHFTRNLAGSTRFLGKKSIKSSTYQPVFRRVLNEKLVPNEELGVNL